MGQTNIAIYTIPQCVRHLHESVKFEIGLHGLMENLIGVRYATGKLIPVLLEDDGETLKEAHQLNVATALSILREMLPDRQGMGKSRRSVLRSPRYYPVGPRCYALATEIERVALLASLAASVIEYDIGQITSTTFSYPTEYHEYYTLLGRDMDAPIEEMVFDILNGVEPVIDKTLEADPHSNWVFKSAVTELKGYMAPLLELIDSGNVSFAIEVIDVKDSYFTVNLTKELPEPF